MRKPVKTLVIIFSAALAACSDLTEKSEKNYKDQQKAFVLDTALVGDNRLLKLFLLKAAGQRPNSETYDLSQEDLKTKTRFTSSSNKRANAYHEHTHKSFTLGLYDSNDQDPADYSADKAYIQDKNDITVYELGNNGESLSASEFQEAYRVYHELNHK